MTYDPVAQLTLEYEQLKAEQLKRITIRDGLIYATLASIAAVIVAAFQAASPLVLLAMPSRRAGKAGQLIADLTVFCVSIATLAARAAQHPPVWAMAVAAVELVMTLGLAHQIKAGLR
jgi:hypothetical protein